MEYTYTYLFASDYSEVKFNVSGDYDWTDEMFDEEARETLGFLVSNPDHYYQQDVYPAEEE